MPQSHAQMWAHIVFSTNDISGQMTGPLALRNGGDCLPSPTASTHHTSVER